MKKNIFIIIVTFFFFFQLQAQEYDFQYCYNLNSSVQEALVQTLQNETKRNSINEALEINLTVAEINTLTALNPNKELDNHICAYVYSSFDEDGWFHMQNSYYRYNFRSDNFFYSVIVLRPKSVDDPDFLNMANLISLVYLGNFNPQLGFQTSSSVLTPLYFDNELELP